MFGSKRQRTVYALGAFALLLAGFLAGRIYESADSDSLRNAEKRATNMMGILETENRRLKRSLQSERLRHSISEKNLKALRDQMEDLAAGLVHSESEISFFKQLLKERSEIDTEIGVRSLDIRPDFRENSYTLDAVLIRNATASSDNFTGSYELALNVNVDGKTSVMYHPEKGSNPAKIDFRYYHEISSPFRLPPDSQILNARFSVYDPQGELIVSKILVEEQVDTEEKPSPSPEAVDGDIN